MNRRLWSGVAIALLTLSAGLGSGAPADHVAAVPAAGAPTTEAWVIERVDAPRIFSGVGQRSLALDAGGRPHIVYGQDRLYYAWYDGWQWQIQTVDDTPGSGAHASLALDDFDQPHVSYYGGDGTLRYAWNSGTSWHITTVDGSGSGDLRTTLALDAAGRPHISYSRGILGGLRYAYFDGTAWHTATVDSAGEYASLALDSLGRPHLSYCDGNDWDLKYATFDGSTWQTQTVDSAGTVGLYSSLALDAAGRPHISYQDFGSLDLRRAFLDVSGSTWLTETVDSAGNVGFHTSIALDAAGRPRISYCAGTWMANRYFCGDVKYARFDGTGWETETLQADIIGEGTSIALDGTGRPYVAYLDGYPTFQLRVAHRDGGVWQFESVDREGRVGWSNSLRLDGAGRPHISYCAFNEGFYTSGCDALRYAYYDGSAWQLATVDRGTGVGTGTSLALDDAGQPRIAYGPARYASFDGSGWVTESVPIGEGPSLALDTAGRPHISSYQVDAPHWNMLLLYAYSDGADWITATVDSRDACGGSLALDTAGLPHIAYGELYLDQFMHLKYAYFDGTAWITTTVDGTDGAGWAPSLALDAAGRPHITYEDHANHVLRYAHYVARGLDTGFWQIETIEAVSFGANSSLALDAAGQPHVAYGDGYGALKYAYYDDGAWQIQTVEDGRADEYLPGSLALDAYGQPHIAYYDALSRDLKYAWLCTSPSGVRISGPATVLAGQEAIYRAEALPLTASLPLAFAWSDGTTTPTATYSWPLTGTYTIAVTVTNPCGRGVGSLEVRVIAVWPFGAYLPLVLRGY